MQPDPSSISRRVPVRFLGLAAIAAFIVLFTQMAAPASVARASHGEQITVDVVAPSAMPDATLTITWDFGACSPSVFTLDNNDAPGVSQCSQGTPTGTKRITATDPAGYNLSSISCSVTDLVNGVQDSVISDTDAGDNDVSVSVRANEHVYCTFTYVATSTGTGTITICKETDPDTTGTAFAFTSSVSGHTSFSLLDDQCRVMSGVSAGSYVVNEIETAGWDIDVVLCSATSGSSAVWSTETTVNISLASGGSAQCTYNNDRIVAAVATATAIPPTPAIVQVPVFVPVPSQQQQQQQIVIVQPPAQPQVQQQSQQGGQQQQQQQTIVASSAPQQQQQPRPVTTGPVTTTLPRAGMGLDDGNASPLVLLGGVAFFLGLGLVGFRRFHNLS